MTVEEIATAGAQREAKELGVGKIVAGGIPDAELKHHEAGGMSR